MYRIKAAIERLDNNQWLLGFNCINDFGDGTGKRVSDLLPYVHTFESREEAIKNLGVILNNRCQCIADLTGKKFKRIATQRNSSLNLYEWEEIIN